VTTDAAGTPPGRVDALVVAAGSGERAGGGVPKQFHVVQGRPIVRWAVEAFTRHPQVERVTTVVAPGQATAAAAALSGVEVRILDRGGATRQESVAAGLEALASDPPQTVLIHDGARPRPGAALISRVIDALSNADGVVPTVPLSDTLKETGDDGHILRTLPRAGLHGAQTPQGFRFDLILGAHRAASEETLATDDSSLLETAGHVVQAVAGDPENLKVTGPGDFARAERLFGARLPRTGQGFDVHRFGPGESVQLLGVRLPHGQALVGHSDADVGLHAVTDAILGALAQGDIGQHFPPEDPRWRDADSAKFLQHAGAMALEAGAEITHVDVTIICEAPAVAPHRERMRQSVADILGMPVAAVSVKATTTEGLGFAGRREGIATFALATVLVPNESA